MPAGKPGVVRGMPAEGGAQEDEALLMLMQVSPAVQLLHRFYFHAVEISACTALLPISYLLVKLMQVRPCFTICSCTWFLTPGTWSEPFNS